MSSVKSAEWISHADGSALTSVCSNETENGRWYNVTLAHEGTQPFGEVECRRVRMLRLALPVSPRASQLGEKAYYDIPRGAVDGSVRNLEECSEPSCCLHSAGVDAVVPRTRRRLICRPRRTAERVLTDAQHHAHVERGNGSALLSRAFSAACLRRAAATNGRDRIAR